MYTKPAYAQQIPTILASIDNGSEEPKDTQPLTEEEPEEFDVYIEEDRITVVKRTDPQPEIVEAGTPQPPPPYFAYVALTLSLLLLCYLVTSAFMTVFFPPTVTITLFTKLQTIKATGTLQLQARVIPPITLSQAQTIPTTGKGHQDARAAQGTITFYNGLYTSQTVQAGTILTGADGVQIATDQNASLPAANPPSLGYATVSAHALTKGSSGNISAYDINQACCATAIKGVNTISFSGGRDERNFQTVAKADIDTKARALKTTLAQSVTGAFQGQLKPQEQLQLLPCAPTVSSDHQPGREAREVQITVSETCSAVAFNHETLITQATNILSHQALQQLGTGYSLLGDIHISVKQAIITHTTPPLVFISFSSQGTWMYALNKNEQQRLQGLLAGKSRQEALQTLVSLPGIEHASIAWDEHTKLPKNGNDIHFHIFIQNSEQGDCKCIYFRV